MVRPSSAMAATKLRPPARPPRLVDRARLTAVLDDAVASRVPLVLVSAPAGSGKSTLLTGWVAAQKVEVAWLQLEESDGDPARFWASVTAAVGRVRPAVADVVGPLVVGSQGHADVVVPALVNELSAAADRLVVVLDDYHLVESADVHRGMERLLELCPDTLMIVLATRADPPFRLGRMRVRGRVGELRASDLRFDTSEAASLLGATAAGLDERRLGELCDRTEGWAAGLVLAGLSLERTADAGRFVETFRGDDQLVAGYLADELLAVLEPEERRRMVEAAVLHRLTGPLLDAVTGTTDGARWLDDLAGRNQLVIRLDSTGEWYRYHHLFRDLLLLEARRSFPDLLPQLNRSAAAWFEANGYAAAAVEHLLIAGDRDHAMDLMRIVGPDLLGSGQLRTLRNLLERISAGGPLDTVCSLLAGWVHYLRGRYDDADRCLTDAMERMPPDFDAMRAMPLRINLALGRGDVATALAGAREVTAAGDVAARPSELTTATGAAYVWAGMHAEAREVLAVALPRTLEEGRLTAHALALVALAVLEVDAGDRDGAQAAAERVIAAAAAGGLAAYHGIAPAFAVRAWAADDLATAVAEADHAVAIARGATTLLGLAFVLTVAGDIVLRSGDSRGGELLDEAAGVLRGCPDPGIARRLLEGALARHGRAGSAPEVSHTAELVEQLSEREMAVLRYFPSALSLRDIAREMYVSLNTVKTHSSAIYRKLAVSSRADAVAEAKRLGLL